MYCCTHGACFAGIIFGRVKPLGIIFEMPVERMARVNLPRPYNRLILWSWHRLPLFLSPVEAFNSSAVPNGITEREIYGSDPQQLKQVYRHLAQLVQRERADEPLMKDDADVVGAMDPRQPQPDLEAS